MIFATYWFFLFVAVFFPLWWLAPPPALRLALLLGFCFASHAHFAGAAGMKPIIVRISAPGTARFVYDHGN